jgi:hypothetical protein
MEGKRKERKKGKLRSGAFLQCHKGKQRKAQRKPQQKQRTKGKAPQKAPQKPQKALQ